MSADPATVRLEPGTEGFHLLHLGATENRFGPDWLAAFDDALASVIACPAPLVLTGSGKFFSNGLDLDWIGRHPDQLEAYVAQVQELLARVLTLPVPTLAAINGHAFGAGAILSLACDWRVMRADRGYFCLPEVDLGLSFTPGMAALVQDKLTPRAALDAMTTGRRFTGPEARSLGLVDATAAGEDLIEEAVARAAELGGKPASTLGAIKTTMFAGTVASLVGAGAG